MVKHISIFGLMLACGLCAIAQDALRYSGKITYIYMVRNSLFLPGESDRADTTWLYFDDTASNYRKRQQFLPIDEIQRNLSKQTTDEMMKSIATDLAKEAMEVYRYNDQTRLLRGDVFYSPWYDAEKKRYAVTDSVGQPSWELHDDTTRILGYLCQRADCTVFYAGKPRSFSAWFATGIPLPYGPSVFYNLPGLILRLESKYYVFEAVEISMPLAAEEKQLVNACRGCPLISRNQRQEMVNEVIRNMKNLQRLNKVNN